MKIKELEIVAVETAMAGHTLYQCPDEDENGVMLPEAHYVPMAAERVTWIKVQGKDGVTYVAAKGFGRVEQKRYIDRGIKGVDNVLKELALESKLLGIGDGVTYSVKSPEEIFDIVVA